ncbi:cupin domain-containing protein [Marinicella rhabdoformis]|uniref:cupin domain-containing protein n=1 Tax=Marinicella rhabdoformis TaxID=2580566 RepID=UPI0015D02837|nr:cupin domain-containing protein [Marinicella rhabdoformis]
MNIKDLFANQSITAEEFLQRYWQKQPFLFRNTSLDFSSLPNPVQLFKLASEEDVQSRIIYSEDSKGYQAIYDDPDAWEDVSNFNPTLLVSDIEKWRPETMAILDAFPFIKSWRLDDLMISFAPTGASVGAHTDHYDVFLIQTSGTRQWSYDDKPLKKTELVKASDLSILNNYQAKTTVELKTGDVLYLPPEIPHHGISTSEDCMTCSIGMRAPSQSEMVMAFAEFIANRCDETNRFTDQGRMDSIYSFDNNDIEKFKQTILSAFGIKNDDWGQLFGQFFSEYRQLETLIETQPEHIGLWQKNPMVTFLYQISGDTCKLFIDGETFECAASFAQMICHQQTFERQNNEVFEKLVEAGYLQPVT